MTIAKIAKIHWSCAMKMLPLVSPSSRKHRQILAMLAILAIPLAAQQQEVIITAPQGEGIQFPGMPGQRQFKTGTGRISGRVLSLEGMPLRRAQVRIGGPEVAPKAALTDTDGRYEFRELPAGRFTLTATKSGYVTVQFGQTRPFESGKQIELSENQRLDKVDITMPRGGVIAGRVLDEFGEPVPDAMVSALRSTWAGGRRRLVNAGRPVQTNDLGQYRLFGLPPGEYFISANLRGEMMMFDMGPMPGVANPSASNPNSGYAPTYFPGTTNGSDAQKVAIAAGQEAQSTDFALLPVKLSRVTGTVINSEGKPIEGAMVNAMPRNADFGGFMMPHSTRTDRNGNFTLSGMTPGDYTLQTRSMQMMSTGDGNTMVFSTRIEGGPGGARGPGADAEFGSAPVSVSGDDMLNVMIVTSKGTTASGRVTFEDGPPPPTLTTVRIMAVPAENEPRFFGPGGGPQSVTAEGTFELRGLSGVRLIRVMNPPSGWMAKAVRLNGNDVTDSGVDFKPGDAVSGIEIVMTSRITEVTGTVKSSDGSAAKDYTVVIFSADADKWTMPMTRYVTGTRPDQEGRFRARNLPPGDYYAIALEYIEQGSWGDPDVLERLKARAKRVSIGEGERKTMDLDLTGASIP